MHSLWTNTAHNIHCVPEKNKPLIFDIIAKLKWLVFLGHGVEMPMPCVGLYMSGNN